VSLNRRPQSQLLYTMRSSFVLCIQTYQELTNTCCLTELFRFLEALNQCRNPTARPASFPEIIHSQFSVVRRQITLRLQSSLFYSKAMMDQVEDRDMEQSKVARRGRKN
jgi:hypothetical protein